MALPKLSGHNAVFGGIFGGVMKKTMVILSASLILVSGLCQAEDSFAYKLAMLEEGRSLEKDSLEVKRTENALKNAMTVCNGQDQETLGQQAWNTAKILREDKVYARPVDILEGLKAILDGIDKKQNCDEYMASYATSRIGSGYSHSEAVAALRVLMNMTGSITYKK